MPYHQAAFHARVAGGLAEMGFQIRRTRAGWEIMGIPQSLIRKFSRRSEAIDRKADELGITDAKEKDKLGALTRENKLQGLSDDELRQAWEARMDEEERKALKAFQAGQVKEMVRVSPKEALDHAVRKMFARDSVVRKGRLLAEALKYGVGNVSPEEMQREFQRQRLIEKEINGETLCTTREVLAEEVALIAHVRSGKGRHAALFPGERHPKRDFLSQEQLSAVGHVLSSNNRVVAIRGGAGTGKTTAMAELVETIEGQGKQVHVFAPSADASRGTLRQAGFKNAQTVEHYLTNPKLQEKSRGQVIWIDEAGMLGTREMWRVMEAAGPDTKVILTGDYKQHGPVPRGNPFLVLEKFAGLNSVEITEIRRQKPEAYKSAVSLLSKGEMAGAFEKLDQMGAIRECGEEESRYRQLASDYVNLSKGKNVPLVASPTRAETALVTAAIRDKLKEEGKLSDERIFVRYQDLHLENVEKLHPEHYEPGMMVQFHQNAKGITRGTRFWIDQNEEGKILTRDAKGETHDLDLANAERFQLYEPRKIKLAQGERIRITKNGFTLDGKRLNNGMLREVAGFTKNGDIKLTTGAVISQEDGHFRYGYCGTSYSSQSKTTRDVLIAQSSESFGLASNREQFYVSVSRGEMRIRIYTDDRKALQEAVGNSSVQLSAMQVAGFDSPEIQELMKKELAGNHWQKAVNQQRTKLESQSFVERVLTERKQDAMKKPQGMVWTDYLEMRKKLAGPSGRHRAKGYPTQTKKGGQVKGYSFLRPTQQRAVQAKVNAPVNMESQRKLKKPDTATMRKSHETLQQQGKLKLEKKARNKRAAIIAKARAASVKAKKQVTVKPPTPKK